LTLNINNSFFILRASSTTLFAIQISSRICLFFTKVDCVSEIKLPITNHNLFASNLVKILYKLPTREMSLKSFKHWRLSILGIKAIKMQLIPLTNFPLEWNSKMNHTLSSLISGQNSSIKLKLIPSILGLLKMSHSQTAAVHRCFW
jgi:hypothetical protein